MVTSQICGVKKGKDLLCGLHKGFLIITWCADSIIHNRLIGGVIDNLGVLGVSQMIQHINASIDHGNRIGDILARNGSARVTGAGFKDSILRNRMESFEFQAYYS